MSKAKFDAAKELIQEKKYTEARTLLKGIDHPTAREWEAKLDAKIAADKPAKKPLTARRIVMNVLVLILLAGVLIFGYMQWQQFNGMTGAAAGAAREQIATLNSP